jgi:hypothetical protein
VRQRIHGRCTDPHICAPLQHRDDGVENWLKVLCLEGTIAKTGEHLAGRRQT